MYYAYLPNKVKSAKMLAILQSAGTVPDERLIIDEGQDYRNITSSFSEDKRRELIRTSRFFRIKFGEKFKGIRNSNSEH